MAHRLVFTSPIPDDLTTAVNHYDKISRSLGDRFRAEVNCRLDEIAQRPESFPLDVSPIRFAKLKRFPYVIFFTVGRDFVTVVAIVHGSSEPREWRQRT